MNYYLLHYRASADYVEARAPYRAEHLELAKAALERGELVLGGADGDPPDGATLVFLGTDASVAEDFANADPYVRNGVVRSWTVRPWQVVIGTAFTGPKPPE